MSDRPTASLGESEKKWDWKSPPLQIENQNKRGSRETRCLWGNERSSESRDNVVERRTKKALNREGAEASGEQCFWRVHFWSRRRINGFREEETEEAVGCNTWARALVGVKRLECVPRRISISMCVWFRFCFRFISLEATVAPQGRNFEIRRRDWGKQDRNKSGVEAMNQVLTSFRLGKLVRAMGSFPELWEVGMRAFCPVTVGIQREATERRLEPFRREIGGNP